MSPQEEERTTGHRSDEVDVVLLRQERSWWTWILLLLGPVTWATHFMVVYLLVEAWCSEVSPGAETWLGTPAPVSATIVSTAVAIVVILGGAAFTARRYRQAVAEVRRGREHATDATAGGGQGGAQDCERAASEPIDQQLIRDRQVLFIGLLLGGLSVVAVLVVGLPALWVPTC